MNDQMMKLIGGLLSGEVDIDELAEKAAEQSAPPDISAMSGPEGSVVDSIAPQAQGAGDPTADLLKLIQSSPMAQNIAAPGPIPLNAMPMGNGAVGGAGATQALMAGVPQVQPVTPPGTDLMSNLKGAFK